MRRKWIGKPSPKSMRFGHGWVSEMNKVYVDETNIGKMRSSLGGKIDFSIELNEGETAKVQVVKL